MIWYWVSKFPETDQCDWLLRKILSISVCNVKVDLVERVICGVKMFEKRCSGNSVVPLFWLHFIRLKLKSPAKKVSFPSALIFGRSGSRNSLLYLYVFIDVCLQMMPSIKLDLFGIKILIKTDCNSFGEYI